MNKKHRRNQKFLQESPRNLFIWWQWSTDGMTLAQLSKYHGVSSEWISQIIRRCELKRVKWPHLFERELASAI